MIKICFIWIEAFRNFENFGINLSSSDKFSFDPETLNINKEILDSLPQDFFGENITEVTGVIGKNGAGKSNALEMICKILKGPKTALQSNFFYIVEEEGNYSCYSTFSPEIKLKSNFKIDFKEREGNINDVKVVFFSNVFDERRYDFDKEIGDISANNRHLRSRFVRPSEKNISEFEKQIRLINSDIFNSLNIDLPKQVLITTRVWDERYNSTQEQAVFGEFLKDFKLIKMLVRDTSKEMPPDMRFVQIITYGFFLTFIRQQMPRRMSWTRNTNEHQSPILDKLRILADSLKRNKESIPELLIGFIEQAAELLDEYNKHYSAGTAQMKLIEVEIVSTPKLKKQLNYLKDLKIRFSNAIPEYRSEGIRRSIEYFAFDYSNKNRNRVNQFFTLFEDNNYIEINWIGISSGHKAYLNLFASLYQELRQTKLNNLLLCIDEGDLYLHPKWQVEFFDKLLSVLPAIFEGKIQLILTSHSPFLLSDLPKQNITILDKEHKGYTFNGTELSINTFGGNLYDLYSEPFFLANKRTSDFAFKKISQVIDDVETKKLTKKEKLEILKIADLLGDEILQFKIKKILRDD